MGKDTPAASTSSAAAKAPQPCEALEDGRRKWRVTVLISGSGSNLAALMTALPTILWQCCVTSVFSNAKDAYGLQRAASHSPPIPASSFSPYNHQKAHPELYSSIESQLKSLQQRAQAAEEGSSERAKLDREWKELKKTLASTIKPRYQVELAERVRATRPDLIVLAGFMLILLPETLETLRRDWDEDDVEWDGAGSTVTLGKSPYPDQTGLRGRPIPIINLHPALPGSFIGPHVIEDAWEAFNQRRLPTKDGDAPGPVWDHDKEDGPSPFGEKITKTGIMIHRVIPELDRGEPVLWKEVEMKEGEALDELKERLHKVEYGAIVEAVKQVTDALGDGTWWDGDDCRNQETEEAAATIKATANPDSEQSTATAAHSGGK
ncbi:BQ2448_5866 [Microbotryum intermedium]|uniref:phosphoribosylglycinamide formyltransferase 1 n=1 Tax=Microbotryum intermedium TaxID=269621 RepID=A0A238EZE2_9BASI|nr:BQ2448_5866 [Microbotryum intermedium]